MIEQSYTCIYCTTTKKKAQFHTEHVIPKALGTFGTDTPTLNNLVCKDCNQNFGEDIDLVLSRNSLEAHNRFKWGMLDISKVNGNKYGKNTVYLIKEGKLRGLECELAPDPNTNNLMLISKTHDLGFRTSEGAYDFYSLDAIPAKDKLNIKYPLHKERIIIFSPKSTPEEIIKILKEKYGENVEYKIYSTQEDTGTPDIGTIIQHAYTDQHFRAISKIAFNYLAYTLYKEYSDLTKVCSILLQNYFDPIRIYILEGTKPSWYPIKGSKEPILLEPDGKAILAHIITIDHTSDNSIIVSVALFNDLHFKVHLVPQYEGQKLKLGYGHGFSFYKDNKKVFDIKKSTILRPQLYNLILPPHFNGKSLLLL